MQQSCGMNMHTSGKPENSSDYSHTDGSDEFKNAAQSMTVATATTTKPCRVRIARNYPIQVGKVNHSKWTSITNYILERYWSCRKVIQKWLFFLVACFSRNENVLSTNSPLMVLGVGQMRTGTSSLKRALEILYNKPCYHMMDVAFLHKQRHISKWLEALQQLKESTQKTLDHGKLLTKEFWQPIFAHYVGAVDYPSCVFYKYLMKVYPEAKCILTLRNPDDWVKSCRATTMCENMLRQPSVGDLIYAHFRGIPDLSILHHRMFEAALGSTCATMSDDQLRDAYCEWNQQVISEIPPDRLLLFDPQEGWEPLCHFLGVPQPPVTVPFPHLNKREEMRLRLEDFYWKGRFCNYFVFTSLVLFVFGVLCSLSAGKCVSVVKTFLYSSAN
ncbi:hypothetical protein CRM22_001878 [Opisthorchis felineus]|uniref:Sulfotransferase domain-containing protein n=1 Tax=Opisthorchis felineus TaxID=147828 RepID=A0A4S2MD10_OPIFE|nr:hypothetical protein CRM22_001878 [Opisthorchis felineus]